MTSPEPTSAATHRRIVASYPEYRQAERAVDHLSDNGFPVQHSAIVARELELVEQVTGRYSYLSAAGNGAGGGAITGALLGWLFGLFTWVTPLISGLLLALYGAILGAIIGAVIGLIAHAMSGGRRDFSSMPNLRADSYDLLVDSDYADQATTMLNSAGAPGLGRAATGTE
ncbi:hypothetical protein DFQ14_108132 [Halopolyspora algeriensis]|uniref:General stress protein 17M-like domain-containing protein n=1 Tax=Halopolyspora algeriensis TaxID=1500506 RepID=A0A368VPU0_9ACTN|nr:general stress protein [Halopolyspora algeriensis]RCW42872.1 hypothetical protein DFQ14_108132 [Halopolyspora algeriensis]TQM56658.1 hypothetical protein FHU43_1467 [Halopolyspora algeriensis]